MKFGYQLVTDLSRDRESRVFVSEHLVRGVKDRLLLVSPYQYLVVSLWVYQHHAYSKKNRLVGGVVIESIVTLSTSATTLLSFGLSFLAVQEKTDSQ